MKVSVQLMQILEKTASMSLRVTSTSRTSATGASSLRVDSPIPFRASMSEMDGRMTTPKLVIFDKDGTLICFHTMWTPWAVRTAERIHRETGLNLKPQIYEILGLCSVENKVKPGLLAEGTMEQIRQSLLNLLIGRRVSEEKASTVVEDSLRDSFQRCSSSLKEIEDLRSLFIRLKRNFVKIAICTADNRNSTVEMMRHTGVENLVDVTVCGDDLGSMPKPHPRNAIEICQRLRIDPEDAVMVGDTKADLIMAQEAGLGAGIGVLSGVGCKDHLGPHASILVNHVGELTELFDCSD